MKSVALKSLREPGFLPFMTALIGIATTVYFAPVTAAAAREQERVKRLSKVVEDYEKQVKKLVSELQDGAIWTDPRNYKKVHRLLETAKVLRAKELATVLSKHITYNDGKHDMRDRPMEVRFPVYAVLKSIGIPSVQPLLRELKKTDPDVTWLDKLRKFGPGELDKQQKYELSIHNQQKYNLILYCLADIYDQGGHGQALAKQRIRLEIKTAKGKARRLLERALKHPALRVEAKK